MSRTWEALDFKHIASSTRNFQIEIERPVRLTEKLPSSDFTHINLFFLR